MTTDAAANASPSALRPPANPHAEAWIRQGDADALQKGDLYTARLTLDITPALRARIKVSAFTRGVTVAELLRGCWSANSRRTPMNVQLSAATAATTIANAPSLAMLARRAGTVPLTRVSLAYVEQRINLYLRFGEPQRIVRLDRWRRVAVFLPGAVFCRIRWEANDYGTIRWQLMVMQACTPLDAVQRIPGVLPGARLLLHAEGEPACAPCWHSIDAIEALGIAPSDVSPAYWRTLGNRLAARLPLPDYTRRAACRLAGREGVAMTTIHIQHRAASSLAPARSHRAGGLRRLPASLRWPGRPSCRLLPRLTYNPSDSVPVGWYRIEPSPRLAARPLSVAASCLAHCRPKLPHWLRSAATCRRTSRCSSVWARSRRNTSASLAARCASTACLSAAVLPADRLGRPLPSWPQCRRLVPANCSC